MSRKQLLLTFDYELFLGKRSGSVDNCLIEPTNKILEILGKHEQIGVFFIDTTYLFRLSELVNIHNSIKIDFEKIIKQLIQIVKDGHYIFHHLHPHWLDAKYIVEINEWDLSNNSRFVFQLLNDVEKKQVFEFSFNFLTGIYAKANSTKSPVGYRAGGLFIEPFDIIKPFFEKYNVKHEFSVLSGSKRNDFPFIHDFSQAPSERKYHFSDIIQQENQEGPFIQYPITSIKIKGLNKILNGIYYRMNKNNLKNQPFGNGKSVSSKINAGIKKKGFMDYFSMEIPASIEMLNPILVNTFIKVLKKSSYLHILSHPKLITPNSLEQLDFVLGKVNKNYSIEKLDF